MSRILGKRGFVTIATGKPYYYKLAVNLLMSYRAFANLVYPFAIIADTENQYTKQFDYTIVMNHPDKGYLNKLHLFEHLPFEETIFIDADCLAYDNLNIWWDYFQGADDFSVFGTCYDPSENKGWFSYDGMKEWKEQISFVPNFNGGVYYIRNTKRAKKVFDIAQSCVPHYSEYSFNYFADPADEPLVALGMAVCGCKPIPVKHDSVKELAFYPILDPKSVKVDIMIPRAEFFSNTLNGNMQEDHYRVRLVHWSAAKAKESVYKTEVWKLRHRRSGKTRTFCASIIMKVNDLLVMSKRMVRLTIRSLHKTRSNK